MGKDTIEVLAGSAENSGAITEKRKGRPENLRPFPKGVSGNPGGRPKGVFGKAALRELRKRAENGETNLEAVIGALLKKARKGDTRAAEFLRDSVDGRPSANDATPGIVGGVNIIWGGPPPPWLEPSQAPQSPEAIQLVPSPRSKKDVSTTQSQSVTPFEQKSDPGS